MTNNAEQRHPERAFERVPRARFRLGLYDPLSDSATVEWTGPVFRDTLRDRQSMRRIVERFNHLTASNQRAKLCIAVFPWER